MQSQRFRAATTRDGFDARQQRSLFELERALEQALSPEQHPITSPSSGDVRARPGEHVRLAAAFGTVPTVLLPNAAAAVVPVVFVSLETDGAFTLRASDGFVNGAASASYAERGLYIAKSDGKRGWWVTAVGVVASAAEVYLEPYLRRTGDRLADAIKLCLSENSRRPLRVVFPSRALTLERDIGPADGLGDDLQFVGYGTTINVAPACSAQSISFPQGAARVLWDGIAIQREDPPSFNIAITCYEAEDWLIDRCKFRAYGTQPPGDLLRGGPALIGAVRCAVNDCDFDHAQCGFSGLGYGTTGCAFLFNRGKDVSDGLFSAVTGGGFDVENLLVWGNDIDGLAGSFGIYVGDDGTNDSGAVRNVLIGATRVTGLPTVNTGGPKVAVLVRSGSTMSNVACVLSTIEVEDDPTLSVIGISFQKASHTTTIENCRIDDNIVGSLGSSGAKGIEAYSFDGGSVSRNFTRDNRGIELFNCVATQVDDNEVVDATSDAIRVAATSRTTTVKMRRNAVRSVSAFKRGLEFDANGFNITAELGQNTTSSATGQSIGFTRAAAETLTLWMLGDVVPDGITTTGVTLRSRLKGDTLEVNATGALEVGRASLSQRRRVLLTEDWRKFSIASATAAQWINDLNWRLVEAAGAMTMTRPASEVGHPGLLTVNLAVNTTYYFWLGDTGSAAVLNFFTFGDFDRLTAVCRIQTSLTTTKVFVGISGDISTTSRAAGFSFDQTSHANWRYRTWDATPTATANLDSGVAAAAGTTAAEWVTLEVTKDHDTGDLTFTINGAASQTVAAATHNIQNSDAFSFGAWGDSDGTAHAVTWDVIELELFPDR